MTQAIVNELFLGAAKIAGLAGLASAVAVLVALLYRWYTHETAPEGITVLAGVGLIAIYLNTTTVLGQFIRGSGNLTLETAMVNTVTFLVAAAAALIGRNIGDRLAREVSSLPGTGRLDTDVTQLVRAVGRVITVTLPPTDTIEDIEGYDPVPHATKEEIGGKSLLFPRRLTIEELRNRIITRLKEDYGIGHVGIEITNTGEVEYLAVGSRASGIGPTLGPGTAAIAIHADPALATSTGDIVQVWRTKSEPERVVTGELRGSIDDIVTIAVDEEDAKALSPVERYRLVTLPADPRPDREFAALLRASDETMGVLTVHDGSQLVGQRLGDLSATVVAVHPADGSVEAIPRRDSTISPGDAVYVIGRPEVFRRLETTQGVTLTEPSS